MLQQLDQDQPPITLYGLLTCPHCRRVKEFLEQHSIPFKLCLVDLLVGEERSRVLSEIQSRNREVTFPTLVVGDAVIVGYRPGDMERVLREAKWISNEKD